MPPTAKNFAAYKKRGMKLTMPLRLTEPRRGKVYERIAETKPKKFCGFMRKMQTVRGRGSWVAYTPTLQTGQTDRTTV